ncbi:hypothetical protein ACFL56_01470 [Candidatus Margulisiibacteriota bacterium]
MKKLIIGVILLVVTVSLFASTVIEVKKPAEEGIVKKIDNLKIQGNLSGLISGNRYQMKIIVKCVNDPSIPEVQKIVHFTAE